MNSAGYLSANCMLNMHCHIGCSQTQVLFLFWIDIFLIINICCSGTGPPQACLNAMLHSNCRGTGCMFYKVAGKVGMYGLMVSLYHYGSLVLLQLWFYISHTETNRFVIDTKSWFSHPHLIIVPHCIIWSCMLASISMLSMHNVIGLGYMKPCRLGLYVQRSL